MFTRFTLAAAVALAACTPAGGPAPPGGGGICAAAGIFRPGAATFAFAGDVMAHRLIQQDAAARAQGFAPALAPVAPFLRRADVTVVNLETPLARDTLPGGRDAGGPASPADNRVYTAYPAFNRATLLLPRTLGRSRASLRGGKTANNHCAGPGPLGGGAHSSSRSRPRACHPTWTVPRGHVRARGYSTCRRMAGRKFALLGCTCVCQIGLQILRGKALALFRQTAPSRPDHHLATFSPIPASTSVDTFPAPLGHRISPLAPTRAATPASRRLPVDRGRASCR